METRKEDVLLQPYRTENTLHEAWTLIGHIYTHSQKAVNKIQPLSFEWLFPDHVKLIRCVSAMAILTI